MSGEEYDVLIIGAGPAGLFAAREMIYSAPHLNILVIDGGPGLEDRVRGDSSTSAWIMGGIGGAGIFSDGTLNLSPRIGGDLTGLTGSDKESFKLVEEVDAVFIEYGAPDEMYEPSDDDIQELRRLAGANGARFIAIDQRHIGTDNAPEVIRTFYEDLKDRGVKFLVESPVETLAVDNGKCSGAVLEGGEVIHGKRVLLATGRSGGELLERISKESELKIVFGPVDVGVRVELPAIIMKSVTDINRDPKFHFRTKSYDDFVRTFCTNKNGFVVKETYKNYIGVNGHSFSRKKSGNTNFALLVQVKLTRPLENTQKYGESIASLATTLGGGKPILQRMGDLRRGRRSTEKRLGRNLVEHTLADVTPGDVAMALPHRIVVDLTETLETLDRIIPGVASDATLIYAPEIKYYSKQIRVGSRMDTSVGNLYAAGDGAGLSRDIVNASATGILAGRGILESLG